MSPVRVVSRSPPSPPAAPGALSAVTEGHLIHPQRTRPVYVCVWGGGGGGGIIDLSIILLK